MVEAATIELRADADSFGAWEVYLHCTSCGQRIGAQSVGHHRVACPGKPRPMTNELITDEMVEAVAKRLDPDAWEMTAGVYQESHGRHYGNAESFIQSARQTARGEARAILRLVAPLIAAKAWDEGYAMSER